MKIICVGRNYIEHAKELQNEVPKEPVIFLKTDTSLIRETKKIYLPPFSQDIHYETEIVLKINKVGKFIQPEYADNYYDEIALGLDLTARDIQNQLKSKGLPWEKSKAFDNSALVGKFIKKETLPVKNISFNLQINNHIVQNGQSKDMIFSFKDLIVDISQYFTLKIGDLIFTGTPAGVGKLNSGDILEAYLENELNFTTKIY